MSPYRDAPMGPAANSLLVIRLPAIAMPLVLRRSGAVALATLLFSGLNASLAQQPYPSYDPIEPSASAAGTDAPPYSDAYHRLSDAGGLPAPRRLPAAHCDEPGGSAISPCPPVAHAPPKRQVHHIFMQPPAGQRPAPSPPAQQPASQIPAGAFVAPPQSGTVVQEQRSLEIRGMRITFPKLTLELPSIELPHWIRRGRATHMELAGGTAPYVAGAAQLGVPRMNNMSVASAQPLMRRPTPPPQTQHHRTPQEPAADQPSLEEDFEQLQLRCQRLEQLLQKMSECQPQPNDLQSPSQACPLPVHRVPTPQQAYPHPFEELPPPQ